MKNVIKVSLIFLVVVTTGLTALYILKPSFFDSSHPLSAVPADAVIILKTIPSSEEFRSLTDMPFFNNQSYGKPFSGFRDDIRHFLDGQDNKLIEKLASSTLFISFHNTGSEKFDALYLFRLSGEFTDHELTNSIIRSNNVLPGSFSERAYENSKITEWKINDGRTLSFVVRDEILIASFTSFLVDDALRKLSSKTGIDDRLTGLLQEDQINQLIVISDKLDRFVNIFSVDKSNTKEGIFSDVCDYMLLKIENGENRIKLSGSAKKGASGTLLNSFNDQRPVGSTVQSVLPVSTAMYYSFSFTNPAGFIRQHVKSGDDSGKHGSDVSDEISLYGLDINKEIYSWLGNELALAILEPPGQVYIGSTVAMVSCNNPDEAVSKLEAISEKISKKTGSGSYVNIHGGKEVGRIRIKNIIPYLFGQGFKDVEDGYYCNLGNFIVFANNVSVLRKMIDEHSAGRTLFKSQKYNSVIDQLSSNGNFLFYINNDRSSYLWQANLSDKWNNLVRKYESTFSGWSGCAVQFINEDSLECDVEASVLFGSMEQKMADLVYTIEADAPVRSKPLITTDPVTNVKQFLFQDEQNTIYLAGSDGAVKWKKQLNESLMGDFHEIDLFNNGSRQFLFNTSGRLYLIDGEGGSVGNYPIRLPSEAKAGITLHSISRNDLVIYVPCSNKRVYAYEMNGKPLPGWGFNTTIGTPSKPVTVIEKDGKNYLVITDNVGGIFITNLLGEAVSVVEEKHVISRNCIISGTSEPGNDYLFFASNIDGDLIKVKIDGTVDVSGLNLKTADHHYRYYDLDDDGSAEHIIIDDDELIVYENDLKLRFRRSLDAILVPSSSIHRIKGSETVITVRSDITNKTWMLTNDGEVSDGFPVKGDADPVVDDINQDGRLYFVAGSSDGNVYIYSLN